MSDLATYAFLPWLRRGVSTEIERRDDAAAAEPRATIQVALTLDAGGTRTVQVPVPLHGPGEVSAIDPRVVVRTWPRADVHDAEPNLFPAVEFGQADFPWRYTPARASTAERSRPWLVLIVLDESEIEAMEQPSTDGRVGVVTIKSGVGMPSLAQSWAWAHVQVSGVDSTESAQIPEIVQKEAHRVVSRLLCPRRLTPSTMYGGFLVPAFERGRLAGLGEDVPEATDALAPAWTTDAGGRLAAELRLPIYHHWTFQTGLSGDFEFLCRKLRAKALPASVGKRAMDVSEPGAGLPKAQTQPMGLEGALLSLAAAAEPRDWNAGERTTFVAALKGVVDRPEDLIDAGTGVRAVAPPLYGRWHAAKKRLETPPAWYHELNSDPRNRVAAGLGTLVVQDQQQQLMASAWDQIDRVNELNQQLRQAQLAREAARRAHEQHVAVLPTELKLLFTAPVQAKIKASPLTVREALDASPIAPGVFEGQFRRVSRPFGAIGRRQGRRDAPAGNLLERLNEGTLVPAPPPRPPGGMATPSRTGKDLAPPWASAGAIATLEKLLVWLLILALILLLAAIPSWIVLGPSSIVTIALLGLAGALVAAWAYVRRAIARAKPGSAVRDGKVTPELIQGTTAPPSFVPAVAPAADTPGGGETPVAPAPGSVSESDRAQAVTDFRAAAAALFEVLQTPPLPQTRLVRADLPLLATKVVNSIDPRITVVASYKHRISILGGVKWEPEDPLEPIMAAPVFEQPMYEPLRDLSQDWLLPGVKDIPANCTSLLVTNQRFIESYVVGLNHEMARELLWNEYPTDQRGSCFRQFWDVSAYVWPEGATPDPELLKDVKEIHTWRRSPLGGNTARVPPPGGNHLVFLVRGEVLQRYPNTMVYAVKAKVGPDGRELDEAQPAKDPVFQGKLSPDISFFGFELTKEQVKGDPDPARDQGWFFVLQEQPSEPRFGLDLPDGFGGTVTRVDDMSWGSLAANQAGLDAIAYIDLDAALPSFAVTPPAGEPTVHWHAGDGARSSDLAYITLQRPFRVALHGSDMIPEEV
jgi:hypothetical protein